MLFTASVKFYNEVAETEEFDHLFISAEKLVDAVEQISGYYGESNVELINIEVFSPYDMLIFEDDEGEDLFFRTKDVLGDRVIW